MYSATSLYKSTVVTTLLLFTLFPVWFKSEVVAQANLPTVVTDSVGSIGVTSATLFGNIAETGSSGVFRRGFVLREGSSGLPTLGDENTIEISELLTNPVVTNEIHTYVFTNCSQTGATGPSQTQCNMAYSGTNLQGQVNVNNGLQAWTVPQSGFYKITVLGAAGGGAGGNGGLGGTASGFKFFNQGTVLHIQVGQMGSYGGTSPTLGGFGGGGNGGIPGSASGIYGSSGGGASDVRFAGSTLADRFIVAGGGGGAAGTASATRRRDGGGGGGGGYYGGGGGTTNSQALNIPGGGGTQTGGGAGGGTGTDGSLGQGGIGSSSNTTSSFSSSVRQVGGDGGGLEGEAGGNLGNSNRARGGGGGSSFIGGVVQGITETGVNNSHGRVEIVLVELDQGFSGSFSLAAEQLQPNSVYQVRAFAQNNSGDAYGDVLSLQLLLPPVVQNATVNTTDYRTANLSGLLNGQGMFLRGYIVSPGTTGDPDFFGESTIVKLESPWDETFTKLDNPADLPSSTGNGSAWSPDGRYLSVSHNISPFVTIYKRQANGMVKLDDPDILPSSTGNAIAWSPDGLYLSVAHNTSPFVTIYKRNGDTFTKLDNPDILPSSTGNGIAWSPDGQYLSVAHNNSPFLTIYKRDGDSFTKVANPDVLPPSTGNDTAWSPDGHYLSIAHNNIPYITIYKRDGDSFTKLDNPNFRPPSTGNGTAWSPDGRFLSVAHGSSPFITIYKRDGDRFLRLQRPDVLPSSTGNGTSWSPDGRYLSVSHNNSPFISIYRRDGITFTRLSNPDVFPSSTGNGTAWSPDGKFLSVAHTTTPFITVYERGGDFFDDGSYQVDVIDLDPDTSYRFQFFAGNEAGKGFSNGISFATKGKPSTSNIQLVDVGSISVEASADAAGEDVFRHGFVVQSVSEGIPVLGASDSRSVSFFPWNETFTRLANPDDLPTSQGNASSWSPDGQFLSIATESSPFIVTYRRRGDSFERMPNPDVLPTGVAKGVAWSPDGVHLTVAHSNSPFVTIYKRNGDLFEKLPNPAILPSNSGTGVAWSRDGNYMVISQTILDPVRLTVYRRDGDIFTRVATPSAQNANRGPSWSPDGRYFSTGETSGVTGASWMKVYKRNGDNFTPLPPPDVFITGAGNSTAWSPDGNLLSVAHFNIPYITTYRLEDDVLTKLPNPDELPAGHAHDVAWSEDGKYLVVSHNNSPYITIYRRDGETFTKLPDLVDVPAGNSFGLSWSPDMRYLAVAHATSPFITMYKRDGDFFEAGSFTGEVTRLRSMTNYQIRSFTENEAGVAYGEPLAFETEGIEIASWEDLHNMRDDLNGGYVLIQNLGPDDPGYDIYAGPMANNGEGWIPIDNFNGILDGQGFIIDGLFIDLPSTKSHAGLFGQVQNGANLVVRDLGLKNVSITATQNTFLTSAGAFIGFNDLGSNAVLERVFSTGSITANENVGGLVGFTYNYYSPNFAIIRDSYSTANVTATNTTAGGLIGHVQLPGGIPSGWRLDIESSYAAGFVTSPGSTGGIIGSISNWAPLDLRAQTTYWNTQSTGQSSSVGGSANPLSETQMKTQSTFTDWDFTNIWQIIEGESYPYFKSPYPVQNPPPGYTPPIEITSWEDLHNMRDDLSGNYLLTTNLGPGSPGYETYAGPSANGGAGWLPVGSSDNHFTGALFGEGFTITGLTINRPGTGYVALFGATGSGANIDNVLLLDVDITGQNYTAGITGENNGGSITNTGVTGTIHGNTIVGGVIGQHMSGTASGLFSYARVSGNVSNIGGIVGQNYATVTQSHAGGTIGNGNAATHLGGIVGRHADGTISQSYSSARINGTTTEKGGITAPTTRTVTNSYWDVQRSGIVTSGGAGAVGLTTAQMRGTAATTHMTGFDFTDDWNTPVKGTTVDGFSPFADGYPVLRSMDFKTQYLGQFDPMIIQATTTTNNVQFTLVFGSQFDILVLTSAGGNVRASGGAPTNTVSFNLSTPGDYTIRVYGNGVQFGFGSATPAASQATITAVPTFGDIQFTSLSGLFSGATNLTQVPESLPPGVTDLSFMFRGATSFNQNIGGWNTAAVTTMASMFDGASSFNQDISTWNTGSVTTMASMFQNATTFDQNIGSWNVSSMSDAQNMFNGVTLRTSNYNALLTGWASQTLQQNVTFHGGNSTYTFGAPFTARQKLTNPLGAGGFNWTITDGGPVLPDEAIWHVPETVLLNEPFAATVSFRLQGDPYPDMPPLTLGVASGSGVLSGVQSSQTGGVTVFRDGRLDAFGEHTLQASFTYDQNGPQTFTSTPSQTLTVTSLFTGGPGRGDDMNLAANQGFVPLFSWTGATDEQWFRPSNWLAPANLLESSIPVGTATERVIIDGQAVNQPVIEDLDGSDPELSGANASVVFSGALELGTDARLLVRPGAQASLELQADAVVESLGSGTSAGRIVLEPGARYVNRSRSAPELEVQQLFTGNRGWRMISSPVQTPIATLSAGPLVTQGFPGSTYPGRDPNLLFWDESDAGTTLQSWRMPSAQTDNFLPGRGYFYFVFDGAAYPGGGGTYTDELPVTVSLTGPEHPFTSDAQGDAQPAQDATHYDFTLTRSERDIEVQNADRFIGREQADTGWNLLGNPRASALSWSSTAPGWIRQNVSNSIYIWDPAANDGAGDYIVTNGVNQSINIAPYQGFWVQATGSAPRLAFNNEALTTSPSSFLGKTQDAEPLAASPCSDGGCEEVSLVEISLRHGDMHTQTWLQFSEQGSKGFDAWDAFRLEPPAASWFTAFTREAEQGSPALHINHLPVHFDEPYRVDLEVLSYNRGTGTDAELELTWQVSDSWHPGLYAFLVDHHERRMLPLHQSGSYAVPFVSPQREDQSLAMFRTTTELPDGQGSVGDGATSPPTGSSSETTRSGLSSGVTTHRSVGSHHGSASTASRGDDRDERTHGEDRIDRANAGTATVREIFMPGLPAAGPLSEQPRTFSGDPTQVTGDGSRPRILAGTDTRRAPARFSIVISNDPEQGYLPTVVELLNNYPNPFNSTTTIPFALPSEMPVRIEVFDLLGRRVALLADGRFDAGMHRVQWNAGGLASGVYVYRITTPNYSATQKMLYLK